MKCPNCGSEQIRPVEKMTVLEQLECIKCSTQGTLSEFGAIEQYNIGKVTVFNQDHCFLAYSLPMDGDVDYAVGFTVDILDTIVVFNTWIRRWGTWLKFLHERIETETLADQMKHDEVDRFVEHPDVQASIKGNFKFGYAITEMLMKIGYLRVSFL